MSCPKNIAKLRIDDINAKMLKQSDFIDRIKADFIINPSDDLYAKFLSSENEYKLLENELKKYAWQFKQKNWAF